MTAKREQLHWRVLLNGGLVFDDGGGSGIGYGHSLGE
jgi:hypothetical protein